MPFFARALTFITILTLANFALGETFTTVLTINSDQSPTTLSPVIGGVIPVTEQAPGSLSSQLKGSLTVELDFTGSTPTSVSFLSTSSIGVIEHPGNFQPAGGPAEFAGIFDLSSIFPGVIGTSSLHNTIIDISGGPKSIDGSGSFEVAGLFMRYTSTMFWDLPGVTSGNYAGYLDEFIVEPSVGNVSLVGNLLTLTLPYTIDLPDAPEQLGTDLNYHLTGVIVATAIIPEPGGVAMMVFAAVGFAACVRRRNRATRRVA